MSKATMGKAMVIQAARIGLISAKEKSAAMKLSEKGLVALASALRTESRNALLTSMCDDMLA